MSQYDLVHDNFSTHQSKQQPTPNTIAAAATIAPSTLQTIVTGTTQIATVTPPLSGQHMLVLIFTSTTPGTFLTTGNVLNAIVPTTELPTLLFYNPSTGKYRGGALNLT